MSRNPERVKLDVWARVLTFRRQLLPGRTSPLACASQATVPSQEASCLRGPILRPELAGARLPFVAELLLAIGDEVVRFLEPVLVLWELVFVLRVELAQLLVAPPVHRPVHGSDQVVLPIDPEARRGDGVGVSWPVRRAVLRPSRHHR